MVGVGVGEVVGVSVGVGVCVGVGAGVGEVGGVGVGVGVGVCVGDGVGVETGAEVHATSVKIVQTESNVNSSILDRYDLFPFISFLLPEDTGYFYPYLWFSTLLTPLVSVSIRNFYRLNGKQLLALLTPLFYVINVSNKGHNFQVNIGTNRPGAMPGDNVK